MVLLVFGVFAATIVGIGFALPDHYAVKRSVVVDAPPDAIYPWVADLRRWSDWAPWRTEGDPSLKFTYGEPAEGEGATLKWKGDQVGGGSLTILRAEPGRGIEYAMAVDGQPFEGRGAIRFEPTAQGTRVTWTDSGDLSGEFSGRYFIPVLERAMGAQFEQGLARLRGRVEDGRKAPAPSGGADATGDGAAAEAGPPAAGAEARAP